MINAKKCQRKRISIRIYIHASYFHSGDRTSFHFGLFFEYVQIRTDFFKKISRALKITEKKKKLLCHYINQSRYNHFGHFCLKCKVESKKDIERPTLLVRAKRQHLYRKLNKEVRLSLFIWEKKSPKGSVIKIYNNMGILKNLL